MIDYSIIAVPTGIVLLVGLLVRFYVTRKGGELVSAESRRSLTGFVLLTTLVVGLASLVVALNPDTTDTLVVGVVRSIPSLLLAGVIVLVSVLLGRIAAALLKRGLNSWSSVLAVRLARFVKVAIITTGAIIALDQLGVSTDLLIILVTAIVAAIALAAALGFGLGSVPLARQVAAGRHVSDRFAVGQKVTVGGTTGTIVDVGLASTQVRTGAGTYLEVPHSVFLEQPIEVHEDSSE